MSRGKVEVLKANGSIVLLTTMTDRLRIQVPANLKPMINPPQKIKVTIEKVDQKNEQTRSR
jgi:hypothetical protein